MFAVYRTLFFFFFFYGSTHDRGESYDTLVLSPSSAAPFFLVLRSRPRWIYRLVNWFVWNMRFCAHELSRAWSLARTHSLWYTSDKRARTRTPLAQPRIWEAWFKRTLTCTVIPQLARIPREFYSRLDTLSAGENFFSFLLIDASHLFFFFFFLRATTHHKLVVIPLLGITMLLVAPLLFIFQIF